MGGRQFGASSGRAVVHIRSTCVERPHGRASAEQLTGCRRGPVLREICPGLHVSVVTFRVMAGAMSCRVEQLSRAKPEVVYDVLMDFERWSDWMPTVSAASWELQGAPDTGVGGIRRVRIGLTVTHDRIVDGTRPHHHAYAVTLPWYAPLKDYRGDVRIEDRPSGCLIVWTATCASRIRGIGKLVQSMLDTTYTRLAAALAQEAEQIAP
jgi:hypothetical protein